MKLWLDDVRPAPRGYTLVKTLAEAKKHLETGVESASLDHDLADGETGVQLLEWMKETGHWPRYKPRVHSGNVKGAIAMKRLTSQCGRPDAPKPPRKPKAGSNRYSFMIDKGR
jgi:hypothetical protein